MSGDIDPFANWAPWTVIEIAGVESPGICVLKGFKRKSGWDKKKGKGTKGATLTHVEQPPAEGTVEFSLWLPEHFAEWDEFRPLFKYDGTKASTAQAVDIWHPALADLDIQSVVTEELGQLEHAGRGLWKIEVKLIEYIPPSPDSAVFSPSGSVMHPYGDNGKPGDRPDPIADEQQRQIAALLAEARKP